MAKMKTINLSLEQACAAQHFGLWLIEPQWFNQAVASIRAGIFIAQPGIFKSKDKGEEEPIYIRDDSGIAHIYISGQMTKKESSFGGASSIRSRNAIRTAVNDEKVGAILMHIDSPGGTAAGTASLARDVRMADTIKPVYTHFEDLGASAAYWVGSQARRVTAEPTSEIGSIGTLAYVVDTSGEFEKNGWKAYVISTGPYKGAFAEGTEITKEQLAYLKETVDDLNRYFLEGVSEGRKMDMKQVETAADGRVYDAVKAKKLGLIDDVQPIDDVLAMIRGDLQASSEQKKQNQEAMRRNRAALNRSNLALAK